MSKKIRALLFTLMTIMALGMLGCSTSPSTQIPTKHIDVPDEYIDIDGGVTFSAVYHLSGTDLITLLEQQGYQWDNSENLWKNPSTRDCLQVKKISYDKDNLGITKEEYENAKMGELMQGSVLIKTTAYTKIRDAFSGKLTQEFNPWAGMEMEYGTYGANNEDVMSTFTTSNGIGCLYTLKYDSSEQCIYAETKSDDFLLGEWGANFVGTWTSSDGGGVFEFPENGQGSLTTVDGTVTPLTWEALLEDTVTVKIGTNTYYWDLENGALTASFSYDNKGYSDHTLDYHYVQTTQNGTQSSYGTEHEPLKTSDFLQSKPQPGTSENSQSKKQTNADDQNIFADNQITFTEQYVDAAKNENEAIERGEISESVLPSVEIAYILYNMPESESEHGSIGTQWESGYYIFNDQLYFSFANRWVSYSKESGWMYRPVIEEGLALNADKYNIRQVGISQKEALERYGAESMATSEQFEEKYKEVIENW